MVELLCEKRAAGSLMLERNCEAKDEPMLAVHAPQADKQSTCDCELLRNERGNEAIALVKRRRSTRVTRARQLQRSCRLVQSQARSTHNSERPRAVIQLFAKPFGFVNCCMSTNVPTV